ncbi:PAN domain-containing protein [Myxococcaceae bacterium GXIMD 01537]
MIRCIPLGLLVACLATSAQADVYRMTYELNSARTGRALQSSFIGQNVAGSCRALCSRTPACMGYSYKKNVTSAPTPNCFLLRSVDATYADTNSISGQPDPTYYPLPEGMMNEMTLLGGDLGGPIQLSEAHPEACRAECQKKPGCAAFVYTRPNFSASGKPECQPKGQPGTLTDRSCCIVGFLPAVDAGTPTPTPDAGTPPATPDAGTPPPAPDAGTSPGGGTPAPLALEEGVDRTGADLSGHDIATPQACRDLCAQEPRCAAFTHVRAGRHGPKPRCYLKTFASVAKADSDCVSGVKALATMSALEQDTDRPGADYRRFDVATEDARLCRDACAKESACVAFTLVRANVHGPSAYCTLKNRAPAPQANNTKCVSGIKQEWPVSPLEPDTDRAGLDLSGRDSASPEACRTACSKDAGCKAFTFVKPGVHGPSGRCYFKSDIPQAKPGNTCCVSGVKW